ncbi:MAG: ABC-2 transporter permease, partial [Oscillospiraceae bacterium]|nr:ABC-2 transporter permease [Oscillospiraceae bacterium]
TLEYDEKSGWAKMQRAMPVTGGQIIGGKFAAMAFVLGILTALSLICNITGVIFFKLPAEPLIALPFITALLQAITLSLCFMAGYRLSSKFTMLIYLSTEIVIAAGVIFVIIGIANESLSGTAVRIISYAAVPVLTATVTEISFIFGKKAVMRDI